MRVLVAEDDGVARRYVLAAIGRLGHDVETATNGKEAWALHQANPFDIVITDWMMPEMDGLELCRRLDADRTNHFTYIVLVTCRDKAEDLTAGILAGADDFLAKPFRREELRARLYAGSRMVRLTRSLCPQCMAHHAQESLRKAG